MNSVATNRYLESLLAGQAAVAAQPGLAALRAHALERANALTVPSTRDEDWRFTDLTPLYQLAFRPAVRGAIPSLEALAPSLERGVVSWGDSPLVRAARLGSAGPSAANTPLQSPLWLLARFRCCRRDRSKSEQQSAIIPPPPALHKL